jgi:hypothetical protein
MGKHLLDGTWIVDFLTDQARKAFSRKSTELQGAGDYVKKESL